MKTILSILIVLMMSLSSFAQDAKPTGFSLINSPQWFYNPTTHKLGTYKGSTYLWNQIFSAKDVQFKIDSLAAVKKNANDSIVLSGYFTQFDGLSKEDKSNKVISISGSSTDVQYPSAKLVYDQLAGKEATLTKGTLTENIDGLVLSDSTRQVIGGATVLQVKAGRVIPTSTNISHGEAAYTNRITSLTTTGSSGSSTLISNVLNVPNYTLAGLGLGGSKITYGSAFTFSNDRDIVDKAYVDAIAAGNMPKTPVEVATTGNITLSGEQTIDTYSAVTGNRVLVWNQTTVSQNGIYVVAAGAWARATDADTWAELYKAYVAVINGSQSGSSFVCTIPSSGTLETTDVTWVVYGLPSNITAGTGLSKTGNTISLNVASSSALGGIKIGSGIIMNGDTANVSTAYAPTSGSANYVQVSPASAQSGNILMSGSGYFNTGVKLGDLSKLILRESDPTSSFLTYDYTQTVRTILQGYYGIHVNSSGASPIVLSTNATERFRVAENTGTVTMTSDLLVGGATARGLEREIQVKGGANHAAIGLTINSQQSDIVTNTGSAFLFYDRTNNRNLLNLNSAGAAIFYSTVNATGYEISGVSTFLNKLRTGYMGTSGQIPIANGISSDFTWTTPLTTHITEGTNLYYTEARVSANSSVVANTAKVSFPGFGTDHTHASYGDHNHSTVYAPISGSANYVQVSPSSVQAGNIWMNGSVTASEFITNINGATGLFTSLNTNTNPYTFRIKNFGADFYFGIEGSTAGGFFTGSNAYESVIYGTTPVFINQPTRISGSFQSTTAKFTTGAAANTIFGGDADGLGSWKTASQIRTILNVADGANAYVHPNHSGDVTSVADGVQTIANNAVTNAKAAQMATKTYKGRTSALTGNAEDVPVATLKTDLGLVKGDVGLGNVDNTSDANKPISSATQTALNGKQASLTGTGFVKSTAGTISYDNSTYQPLAAVLTNTTAPFTTAQETKLAGIATGATSNRIRANAYAWLSDTVTFQQGDGVSLSQLGKVITISAPGAGMVYPSAGIPISTGSAWGTSITDNSTNWNTAYSNRIATFTTTGSSGAASFSGNTLNIPNYTLAGLGGIGLTNLSSTATGLTYTNTTGVFSLTSGYSIPTTTSQTNWDAAYSEVNKAGIQGVGSAILSNTDFTISGSAPPLIYLNYQAAASGGTQPYSNGSAFTDLAGKQATLVSGTNIKTINGSSILGAGDLTVTASAAWGGITGTLSSQTDLQTALNGKEASLGNPATNGYVLSSTTGGTRSWIVPNSGSGTSGRVTYWNGTNSLTSDADFTFDGIDLRVGATNGTGVVYSGDFAQTSDRRLKQGIRPLKNTNWTNKIKFVRYEMKADPSRDRYGVIAQDVEKYAPELVHTDKEGMKSVSYIDLLIAKVAELEKRIKELENEK